MHIPDSILSPAVVGVSSIVAAGGVVMGLVKLPIERIPRVGVLSAVFFVASLIHIPIPPFSVHLMLAGLLGCILGFSAMPAIACGLLLQAVLFGYGGVTSLGANVLVQGGPAVISFIFFGRFIRQDTALSKVAKLAFAAGVAATILSTCLLCTLLLASGREFIITIKLVLLTNIPIIIIEGFVTASAMVFIRKVKPELLVKSAGG